MKPIFSSSLGGGEQIRRNYLLTDNFELDRRMDKRTDIRTPVGAKKVCCLKWTPLPQGLLQN